MSFDDVVSTHFPGMLKEDLFVKRTLELLEPKGFTADNTIACVAVCRDELCTSLQLSVREIWGEAFNMSSLAGMVFCGITAFGAMHAHAPTGQDKERYVYYSMAHIGIGPGGEIGECVRAGRDGTSKACGALCALLAEVREGRVPLERDPDDIEQSLLRQVVLQRFDWGAQPDLLELTKVAAVEARETLEEMIALTVNPDKADYAVFNGVQVHGPGLDTSIWPATTYAVLGGTREDIAVS